MPVRPRAITLDLDDTLWPIAPVIEGAERALQAWLAANCPRTAGRYPVERMRALRERVARERPDLAHDFSAQRGLSLRLALMECGEDPAHADAAFAAFLDARMQVQPFPDSAQALVRLAARVPVAALTNGNADLARIGLGPHFRFCLSAREHGAAKPDPGIYLAACARLGVEPEAVLHVGDDPELDVRGALRAGLQTCWINRDGRPWPATDPAPAPALTVGSLGALADWLDHQYLTAEAC